MSHSTRLPASTYLCVGRGETKKWKTSVSRTLRRKVNQQLAAGDFDSPFPIPNSISTEWDSPGDGKRLVFPDNALWDDEGYKTLFRK